jgi:glycerophosphoryl diester phosphodiesterase
MIRKSSLQEGGQKVVATGSKSRTLNIAHRGACSLAPENTLVAGRKALELGADMWELDLRMTADGELIAIHDSTLERTSNVKEVFPKRWPWRVSDFNFDEIRLLDFGSWFEKQDPFSQIAAGVVAKSELAGYVGEPAPSLEEVLNFISKHDWRVNLEIKDLSAIPGQENVVRKVVALVERLGMANHILISSFNQSYLQQVRELQRDIPTGFLVSKRYPRPDTLLRQLGARAYHPRKTAFSKADVRMLKSKGFHVHVWKVNDKKTMERMIGAGVSGIFTDYPQLLTTVLAGLKE